MPRECGFGELETAVRGGLALALVVLAPGRLDEEGVSDCAGLVPTVSADGPQVLEVVVVVCVVVKDAVRGCVALGEFRIVDFVESVEGDGLIGVVRTGIGRSAVAVFLFAVRVSSRGRSVGENAPIYLV